MNLRYAAIAFFTCALMGAVQANGQYADTFHVTVADKTPEHPYYNQGYHQGYVVNGLQSPTITLVRDSLYLFNTDDVPNDLVFDFYTIPIGGGEGFYRHHVEKHEVSKGLWTIKADEDDPDTLYYACMEQAWMGGTILIVDSITSSVEESRVAASVDILSGSHVYPNPFAGTAEVRFVLDARAEVRVEVADVLGQVVQVHQEGSREAGNASIVLEATGLAPGVYFYRVEALQERKRSVATGTMQIVR